MRHKRALIMWVFRKASVFYLRPSRLGGAIVIVTSRSYSRQRLDSLFCQGNNKQDRFLQMCGGPGCGVGEWCMAWMLVSGDRWSLASEICQRLPLPPSTSHAACNSRVPWLGMVFFVVSSSSSWSIHMVCGGVGLSLKHFYLGISEPHPYGGRLAPQYRLLCDHQCHWWKYESQPGLADIQCSCGATLCSLPKGVVNYPADDSWPNTDRGLSVPVQTYIMDVHFPPPSPHMGNMDANKWREAQCKDWTSNTLPN